MTGNPNGPWSVSSPMMAGMVEAEIVNINSADNSVQIRLHGYQDDQANIPNEGLEWVKVLGQHSGMAGATATHNYYPGAKVMVSMSGTEKFVVGSVTGYDSDKTKDKEDADSSDNTDPNIPRQARGPKPPGNRGGISVGEGTDQTSKGTRGVQKTDDQYDNEQPQKIFEYTKQVAPFDKGTQSKFPDLKSIGVPKLQQGSNVLDTIDQMDDNVSGAIKASTKIIRNMENSGFGDVMSMINGGNMGFGGSGEQARTQVAQYHGNMQLGDLINALEWLMTARSQVKGCTINTTSEDLVHVPTSLEFTIFQVDPGIHTAVQEEVTEMDVAATNPVKRDTIQRLNSDFEQGFNQAVAHSIAYVEGLIDSAGTAAVLVAGAGSIDTLNRLIAGLQAGAAAANMPASTVSNMGGGQIGQIIQQGATAIQAITTQAQGLIGKIQNMIQNLNTFSPELNALGEIMGGGSSIQESLTKITMKFNKKRPNLDARGFTDMASNLLNGGFKGF